MPVLPGQVVVRPDELVGAAPPPLALDGLGDAFQVGADLPNPALDAALEEIAGEAGPADNVALDLRQVRFFAHHEECCDEPAYEAPAERLEVRFRKSGDDARGQLRIAIEVGEQAEPVGNRWPRGVEEHERALETSGHLALHALHVMIPLGIDGDHDRALQRPLQEHGEKQCRLPGARRAHHERMACLGGNGHEERPLRRLDGVDPGRASTLVLHRAR